MFFEDFVEKAFVDRIIEQGRAEDILNTEPFTPAIWAELLGFRDGLLGLSSLSRDITTQKGTYDLAYHIGVLRRDTYLH